MSATTSNEGAASPTTAIAVANYFLGKGWDDRACPAIDQMKLQKLVFYAQAWYLAYHNAPLFPEDIEAWPWGPVVRPIYAQTKDYGRAPITARLSELKFDEVSPLKSRFVETDVQNADLRAFLDRIWDVHKPYSGIQLSNSTHAAGEPWTIIQAQYGSLDSKPVIPTDLIAAIYRAKLDQSAAA